MTKTTTPTTTTTTTPTTTTTTTTNNNNTNSNDILIECPKEVPVTRRPSRRLGMSVSTCRHHDNDHNCV